MAGKGWIGVTKAEGSEAEGRETENHPLETPFLYVTRLPLDERPMGP